MAWRIELTETAKKQLRKLGHAEARRIVVYLRERVEPLEDPRSIGQLLSGPLGGLWRYRVGNYRLICELRDEDRVVLVLRLGHRREVYR